MNAFTDHVLLQLMEEGDEAGIRRLCEEDPAMQQVHQDYLLLLQGFLGLRNKAFASRIQADSVEEEGLQGVLKKGMKGLQVDQFKGKVQQWETEIRSTPPAQVKPLSRRRLMAVAASIIILIGVGVWMFQSPLPTIDVVSNFAQEGPSFALRSQQNQMPPNLYQHITNQDWNGYLSDLSAIADPNESVMTKFYRGYALLKLEDFKSASTVFLEVINSDIPFWSEAAQFNRMLCLYQLGDVSYADQLDEILEDPNHEMKEVAQEFKVAIGE